MNDDDDDDNIVCCCPPATVNVLLASARRLRPFRLLKHDPSLFPNWFAGRRAVPGGGGESDLPMMSTRCAGDDDDVDDGRSVRRSRRSQLVDVHAFLAIVVALALLAQQTSGVGGEVATAADRKSRKRQSSVVHEDLPPLSTVEDDPYETETQTRANMTSSNRRGASSTGRQHFEFVNPKPGKLGVKVCDSAKL